MGHVAFFQTGRTIEQQPQWQSRKWQCYLVALQYTRAARLLKRFCHRAPALIRPGTSLPSTMRHGEEVEYLPPEYKYPRARTTFKRAPTPPSKEPSSPKLQQSISSNSPSHRLASPLTSTLAFLTQADYFSKESLSEP